MPSRMRMLLGNWSAQLPRVSSQNSQRRSTDGYIRRDVFSKRLASITFPFAKYHRDFKNSYHPAKHFLSLASAFSMIIRVNVWKFLNQRSLIERDPPGPCD